VLTSTSLFAGDSFEKMLKMSKKQDTTFDFDALRREYELSKKYNPSYFLLDTSWDAMYDAIHDENPKRALKFAAMIFKKNAIDIQAHYAAALAYQMKGDDKKASYHWYMADGLLRSIAMSGNGKTDSTAFKVTTIKEEYAFLEWLGLEVLSQAGGGDMVHTLYDYMTAVSQETGDTLTLIFDVSATIRDE